MNPMLRIIVLLWCCLGAVLGTLVITSPLVTDFPQNTIDYFYANFGEIPYGKTLSFDLVILQHSLCSLPADLDHLQKPTYLVIKTDSIETCSYTKRALIAQSIGAKGLIVASPKADYAKGTVIESDDGNGKKVHITCLHITNQSFQKLRKLNRIQIVAKFPIPQEAKATVSIFISASKRSTYTFLRQFKTQFTQLKSNIILQPIYHTMSCQSCNQDNCYLNEYCCFDYQNGQYNVGQKIIREELHQMAIFNQRGPEKWLEYMNLFDKYCDGDWNTIQQCTKAILKKMNMDDVYNADPINTLAAWRVRESSLGFDSFPEVAINNMIYRGNMDASEISDAICAGLTSPPLYCSTKIPEAPIPSNKSNSHVVIILIVTIAALIVVIAIGICLYKKFIKSELTKDMASRVGEIVANYANKVTSQKKRQRERLSETLDEEL